MTLVIDHASQSYDNTKSRLHKLVALGRISSIKLISDYLEVQEEIVKEYILDLVRDGLVDGIFCPDGTRFFLSNVKTSTAPVISSDTEPVPEIKRADTKHGKIITITGLVMFFLGSFIRIFASVDIRFDNLGTAVFMLGLPVLIAGWMLYSRANPPSKIR